VSMIEGLNGIHSDLPEDKDHSLAAMRDVSSDDEFIAAMESMAADVPPLPRDFSREDIYFPKD
jgi:hypothetical protein